MLHMTDEELEALYWAAFEAEIRSVYTDRGEDSEMADEGWAIVLKHSQAPSVAGLRALYEAGTKCGSSGSGAD
jgi:hypothetical protein